MARFLLLRPRHALGLLAAVALLGAGCSRAAPGTVRSVLLVTLDTVRDDALTLDAAGRALTPHLAALAERGVRFPRAYTVTPLTLPAHASLLTGLVPHRHGIRENGFAALPEPATTLAEVLAARGYATGAFVSSLVLDRGFALDQGFATWDQPALVERRIPNESIERPAAETARRAVEWLAALDEERPFFLWAHFYDAHLPYVPAPEHLERAGGNAYLGEIAALDDAVGVLLAALAEHDRTAETLIVVTSDHGEGLGEHGEPAHGGLLYDTTVRVPLLLAFPHEPPAPGPARIASLVDLVPTILGRLGLPAPAELDGLDLFAPTADAARGAYLETFSGYLHYGWSPYAGWVDDHGKYLHSSAPELYAGPSDPRESRDLAAARPELCARARERLGTLLARPALPSAPPPEHPALDSALFALGYARGAAPESALPSPLEPSDRPSPRAQKHELVPLQRAHVLFESGQYAEALPLVEGIVQENPRHPLALDYYALCLMYAGRFAEAETRLRQRLTLGETADTRLNLGLCRLELGFPQEALVEIERARELAPEQPAVLEGLAKARAALGE
ncbi:MAG TPA: sulfatase-like hydrolase/transferase [Planctomycetota bacterium]